jgi:di/tripeptidase
MNTLLDRFCRYVRIDTQADEKATTYPSSVGQLELGRLVAEEVRALGLPSAQRRPAPAAALAGGGEASDNHEHGTQL